MSTFHSVSAAGSDLIGSCLTTTALPLQMKTLMRKAKSLPAHVVSRKHRRKQISLGFCNEKTEGEKLITSCFFLNLDKKKQTAAITSSCLFLFCLGPQLQLTFCGLLKHLNAAAVVTSYTGRRFRVHVMTQLSLGCIHVYFVSLHRLYLSSSCMRQIHLWARNPLHIMQHSPLSAPCLISIFYKTIGMLRARFQQRGGCHNSNLILPTEWGHSRKQVNVHVAFLTTDSTEFALCIFSACGFSFTDVSQLSSGLDTQMQADKTSIPARAHMWRKKRLKIEKKKKKTVRLNYKQPSD